MTTDNRLFFDIVIGEVHIKALCDTGSNCSYLGPKFCENFKHKFRTLNNTAMVNATGQMSPITEKLRISFHIDGLDGNIDLKVAKNIKYDMVLGMNFAILFKIEVLQQNMNGE